MNTGEKSWLKKNFWTLLLSAIGLGMAVRVFFGESELKEIRKNLEQAELKLKTQDSLLSVNKMYIDSIKTANDSLESFVKVSRISARKIDEELERAKRDLGYDKINKNLREIRSEIQDIQKQTPVPPIPVKWY